MSFSLEDDEYAIVEDILDSLTLLNYEDLIKRTPHHLIVDERLPANITVEYKHSIENDAVLVQILVRKWNTQQEDEKVRKLYDVYLMNGFDYIIYECEDDAYDLVRNFLLSQKIKPLPHPNKELIFSGGGANFYFYKTDQNEVIDDPDLIEERYTEQYLEEAEWIGKTGLPEEVEREVPAYIRMEQGEYYIDEESTHARELIYLGKFSPIDSEFAKIRPITHIWHISNHHNCYAVVDLDSSGSCSLSGFHESEELNNYTKIE